MGVQCVYVVFEYSDEKPLFTNHGLVGAHGLIQY